MESILGFVQRRLGEEGPARWEAIARDAGCPHWLPRKVYYYKHDPKKPGPGVNTLQPLVDYFTRLDAGSRRTVKRAKAAA